MRLMRWPSAFRGISFSLAAEADCTIGLVMRIGRVGIATRICPQSPFGRSLSVPIECISVRTMDWHGLTPAAEKADGSRRLEDRAPDEFRRWAKVGMERFGLRLTPAPSFGFIRNRTE